VRRDSGEVEAALGIQRLDGSMVVRALARLALAKGVDGVDRLFDMLVANPDLGGAVDIYI